MRPKEFDIDVADENLTGFASNVTGASFVLTATAPTDGIAHQVSIKNDSGTDHSGKTVTLVGTDADNLAQTEVVTGPGAAATVESTKYFKTLTSATPSSTIGADTFDIGWVDEVTTKTIPIDWRSQIAAAVSVYVTGTINFSVQETFDAVQSPATIKPQQDAHWVAVTALASKTAHTTAQVSVGATAIRVIVNSYSSGAELQAHVSQPMNT